MICIANQLTYSYMLGKWVMKIDFDMRLVFVTIVDPSRINLEIVQNKKINVIKPILAQVVKKPKVFR